MRSAKRKWIGGPPAWLERHVGPAYLRLSWIAEDLRASRTKAQREELAAALERLATEVLNLERPPKGKRGAKGRYDTRRRAALVNALMKYRGAEQLDAVLAVVGEDKKARERVERFLRGERQRKVIVNYSHNPVEFAQAAARLPKVHRIK
jgi:hypothetical protein